MVLNGTTIGSDATLPEILTNLTLNNATVAGSILVNGSGSTSTVFNGGTITTSGQLTVFRFNGAASNSLESDGTITINNRGTFTNNSGNLTLGPGSNTTIDAGGALTLANATAANLRGGVLVNNGTVNGSLNVGFNAVAKGSGTFNGTVTVQSGGRLSPGNSPGTLTSTASDWQDGGIYHWEIAQLASAGGAPGTGWDLWNAGSAVVTPAGNFIIELQSLGTNPGGGLAGWDPASSSSWLIATATNGAFTPDALSHLSVDASGFSGTNSLGSGTFSLGDSADGNQLYLNFTSTPEPASLALFAIGAAGLLLRRRRQ